MDSQRADQMFDVPLPEAPTDASSDTYETRRDHILRSATLVFAQHGYEKASMRAIAKAADMSLAGLYHYFDRKEQLLFVMQFRVFSSLLASLQERLVGVEEPRDRLCTMIRAHITYFAEHMAELKVCSHELDSLEGETYEQAREIRLAYYTLTREIIAMIIKENPPEYPLDIHVATMSLFGTLNWLYRWWNPTGPTSPKAIATQITNQFLAGICAPAASHAH
ncbi:MAG: TetR/AcrR family transcriptional regulator [Planctomycetes bacterium]|nr:TetR/AcrR family transcriptional regulator [Planctomycetota bacterium]MCP4839153.1 TetR/AcrR family transcriptional regulator [Planctomycetota bacterium]